MPPVLKLRFQGQIHRLMLPEGEPTFEAVVGAVGRTGAGPRFMPKYRDEEGDLCTLCSLSFPDFLAGSSTAAGQLVLRVELVDETHDVGPKHLGFQDPGCNLWESDQEWDMGESWSKLLQMLGGLDVEGCFSTESLAMLVTSFLPRLIAFISDNGGSLDGVTKMLIRLPELQPIFENVCALLANTQGMEHCESPMRDLLNTAKDGDIAEAMVEGTRSSTAQDTLLLLLTSIESLPWEARLPFLQALLGILKSCQQAWFSEMSCCMTSATGGNCSGDFLGFEGMKGAHKCAMKGAMKGALKGAVKGAMKGAMMGKDMVSLEGMEAMDSMEDMFIMARKGMMVAKGMMAAKGMMTAMHSMVGQDCEKGTGKGKKGHGPGKCWGKHRFEEVGGKDTMQPARRCARVGCPFAAAKWHPSHCCNDCHAFGGHGPHCQKQAFDVVTAAPDRGDQQQQHQRRCARAGCSFAAAKWHPSHCCNDCHKFGGHGPRCRKEAFDAVAAAPDCGDQQQQQRRCARFGCPFAAAEWHPSHCCKVCQEFGGHGPRCQKQVMDAATATQDCVDQQKLQHPEKQLDLSLPVVVEGCNLAITWNPGDDIQQVAEAFAQEHTIHLDDVPNMIAALQQHAVIVMGSSGEACNEVGNAVCQAHEQRWRNVGPIKKA